jgi:hypothetical protein
MARGGCDVAFGRSIQRDGIVSFCPGCSVARAPNPFASRSLAMDTPVRRAMAVSVSPLRTRYDRAADAEEDERRTAGTALPVRREDAVDDGRASLRLAGDGTSPPRRAT